jgi:tRNA pseudouridine55 synthase
MSRVTQAILPVWKPIDWTSFDVVKKIKSKVKPVKVGHAGTLDPFAEGLLLICIGKATKKVEKLMSLKKEYIAKIKLGTETDTQDITGNVTDAIKPKIFSENQIKNVLNMFLGEIEQIPPMYSALKHKGQRLYSLARKGIEVERKPRKINIYDITLLDYGIDFIEFKVLCGRGTYVRTLGSDIAKKMNSCGHLVKLKRTKIGDFSEKQALKIESIEEWLSTAA